MTRRTFRWLVAALLALAAPAPVQGALYAAPATAQGATTPAGSQRGPSATASSAPTGALPSLPAAPRTLRSHWHVFAAFAVAWALLFGYVLSLGRRWKQVEREVRAAMRDVPPA